MSNNSANYQAQYVHVCNNATGIHLVGGFKDLGPITTPLDTLSGPTSSASTKVAAQELAHFVEAWRYASASLHAYMTNARANAVHFAYYAELRAALTLFAHSGISVNQVAGCFFLDASGTLMPFSMAKNPTHTTVWGLWKEWVKRADAKDLLGGLRLTAGVKLKDIADTLSLYAAPAILKGWGYDLIEQTLEDHTWRNKSSYDPLFATEHLFQMDIQCVGLIKDIWHSLVGGQGGVGFDENYIRFLVDRSARALVGAADSQAGIDMEVEEAVRRKREQIIASVSASTGTSAEMIRISLNQEIHRDMLKKADEHSSAPENVLSRAFFLLRLAALAIESNLGASDSAPARQWLRNWLVNAGLYAENSEIQIEDVRQDYEEALASFAPVGPFPSGIWISGMSEHANRLARPEAFLSWGLPL